ncbi:protein of inositol phosphatase family [Pseudohyphozyma bogoriensis]|nr:protein of inositol phosphatase family [Pseudohyphozyma bogoriensis]
MDHHLPASSKIEPLAIQAPLSRLVVTLAKGGLVLHPVGGNGHKRYRGPAVSVSWGKDAKLERIDEWDAVEEDAHDGCEFSGVVGLLRGFHDSFLIVIQSSTVAATLFNDPFRTVYSIDSLLAVPLSEPLATPLLQKLSLKQRLSKPSDWSTSTSDDSSDSDDDAMSTAMSESGLSEAAPEADAAPIRIPKKVIDQTINKLAKKNFWKKGPLAKFDRSAAGTAAGATATPFLEESTKPELTRTPPPLPPRPGSAPAPVVTSSAPPPLPPRPKQVETEDAKPVLDAEAVEVAATTGEPEDKATIDAQKELDEKIVRECMKELKGMYWSTGMVSPDITHSLARKHEILLSTSPSPKPSTPSSPSRESAFVEPLQNLPLWRRADKRFWWNAHLAAPFVDAGLHSYVLVVQQGFIRQTSVLLPIQTYSTLGNPSPTSPVGKEDKAVEVNMVIMSRRSIERAGLRYQRRGINVQGGVANFVETEFLVGAERDGKLHVSSFVQTRGSIPVFWSQSPWALKPPPVLERTPAESLAAMTKHFEKQTKLYGRQVIVNLAETSGKEALVVNAYKEGVEQMAKDNVKYMSWDFHHQTKGMKYENISKLISELYGDLEDIGCFWSTDSQIYSLQSGAVRTNCIDCLDRTNVVQSAIARWFLNRHLVHLGLSSQEEAGMHDALDLAFNGLWADNGDAISREYAGTSALKGDFTRTGKRNLRGALNDASNSVARLLQSTVSGPSFFRPIVVLHLIHFYSDFFKQATIDYVLGHNLNVFAEFQSKLGGSDPGEILRLAQIRLEAIETSAQFVLSEGEERLAGWTLLSPEQQDAVRSTKYEEKVLLLSDKAVYVVSYEYSLQKVLSFKRIPIGDIAGIQKGAYLLSALDPSARDPSENFGFKLFFHDSATTERVWTYSLRVKDPKSAAAAQPALAATTPSDTDVHFYAFKVLRKDAVRLGADQQSQIISRREEDGRNKSAKAGAEEIISRLLEECEKFGAPEWVKERDIIGLAEAQAQTSILDKLNHKLQSLIWLG